MDAAVPSTSSSAAVLVDAAAPSTSSSAAVPVDAAAPSKSSLALVQVDAAAPSTSSLPAVLVDAAAPSTSLEASGSDLNRRKARDGLREQAQRMVKRSRIEHISGNPGNNVTVPIPLVDRGRVDPRNIMGVIVDRDNHDLYRIAVKGGVLATKYARNQFDLCSAKILSLDDMSLDREIGLRSAVQFESVCGGQGFVKCGCLGIKRCSTNKCKCYRAKVKCNSRCHACLVCSNKT